MKQKITFLTLVFVILATTFITAQITPKISLQGILREASGLPVADGIYDMTFNMYTDETGGSSLWDETHTGVQVTNGIYAVKLGAINALNDGSLSFTEPYFVGITIGGTELTPRVELTYSPYSIRNIVGSGCTGAVGDIKYSILPLADFQAENGTCWVQLDGADITGSILATDYGWTTLPDMSGKFIRSHEYNDGDDPDRLPTDAVATFQDNDVQDHIHKAANYTMMRLTGGGFPGNTLDVASTPGYQVAVGLEVQNAGPGWESTLYSGGNVHPTLNTQGNETRPKNMNFYVYIRVD